MKHYLPLFLLLSLALLAACGQSNKTLLVHETLTPSANLALSTATATDGPWIGMTFFPPTTWSPTPTVPTKTPRPSSTLTVQKPTETPDVTSDESMTEQAYEQTSTQIASFPTSCDQFYFDDVLISPNGTWMAVQCGYKTNQTLEIDSKVGKQWVLNFKDFLPADDIRNGFSPMGGLYPKHWTGDDAFLYFTSYIAFDAGGTCVYGSNASGLYRINVNIGTVSTILSTKSPLDGYEVAFSPGGGKLAYLADRPAILDFRTGEKITIDPGEGVAGNLAWSPDGSELAFAVCIRSENFYSIKKSGIKIFSLKTRELRTIIEEGKSFLSIDKADENQQLKIARSDDQTGKTDYYYFDWPTGRLFKPTPTLQP